MPASPQDLFAYLDRLGVAHRTLEHAATFTVEEGRDLKAAMPGGHTKNLFMTNKDGDLILISAHADSVLPLNRLHRALGVKRLSFADAETMQAALGVAPGSVTAFALMSDSAARVRFILDAALLRHDPLNFHPLANTATTAISRADFERFVASTGRRLETIDFSTLS